MNPITIIDYQPHHQPYFEIFNRHWIEKYFQMEELDKFILSHPDESIIQAGGSIFMAAYNDVLAGTAALRKMNDTTFEFTKMAVEERFHRKGIAEALCYASFEKAKKLGVKTLILYTNNILKPAIHLYEKVGFTHVPANNEEYKRANVKMTIQL